MACPDGGGIWAGKPLTYPAVCRGDWLDLCQVEGGRKVMPDVRLPVLRPETKLLTIINLSSVPPAQSLGSYKY